MKNKSAYPFLIVLLLMGLSGFGQQEYILGRLLDSESEEPVVFANVRIKDRAVGIITNLDGSFRIPMKYKTYGDIIEISSMGYETKEIPITDFVLNELNIITLDPGAIALEEAVVKARKRRRLSAKQIVQKAIDAIPTNYPEVSFSIVGYYRDYQFKDGEYLNLNEGIMEVFDRGFDQVDDHTSDIRIFNYDLNEEFKQDSLARMAYDYNSYEKTIKRAYLDAYGGNEFRILRIHDAIRNYNLGAYDYIGSLETDLIENHSLLKSQESSSEGEPLYGIAFWVRYPNYRAHGKLYISKFDFAIHKLEYTMYDNKRTNATGKKNKHGHKQKVIFDVVTDYRKIRDQMYLNYISFHNSFEVRKPPKFALDSTVVDLPGGYFVLHFNKAVDSISAKNTKNYDLIHDGKKLNVQNVEVFQDSVRIQLDSNFVKQMRNERGESSTLIRKGRVHEIEETFEIYIRNVKDIEGNLVNEPDIEEYLQFREYFVQRVKPDSRAPIDGRFMNKRKPIFDMQPISRPADYQDYWMNTPLLERIN